MADERDIKEILKRYDPNNEHEESLSFCVGKQDFLDLSQFEEHEVVRSDEFDTYCIKYFCGKHDDCLACSKNPHRKK